MFDLKRAATPKQVKPRKRSSRREQLTACKQQLTSRPSKLGKMAKGKDGKFLFESFQAEALRAGADEFGTERLLDGFESGNSIAQ